MQRLCNERLLSPSPQAFIRPCRMLEPFVSEGGSDEASAHCGVTLCIFIFRGNCPRNFLFRRAAEYNHLWANVDKLHPSSEGSSRGALWREACLSARCEKAEVHAAIVRALRCNGFLPYAYNSGPISITPGVPVMFVCLTNSL